MLSDIESLEGDVHRTMHSYIVTKIKALCKNNLHIYFCIVKLQAVTL